jgi:hypothetical protein
MCAFHDALQAGKQNEVHPPYSPDLAPGVLRSIPKEAFADSFQTLYEHCQQCVVKDGDYFEGQ